MWFLYGVLIYISTVFGVIILSCALCHAYVCLRYGPKSKQHLCKKDKKINPPNPNIDCLLNPLNQLIFKYFSAEEKIYCQSAPNEAERKYRFLQVLASRPEIMRDVFDGLPQTNTQKETENPPEPPD